MAEVPNLYCGVSEFQAFFQQFLTSEFSLFHLTASKIGLLEVAPIITTITFLRVKKSCWEICTTPFQHTGLFVCPEEGAPQV